jgi:protein ImuB
LEEAKHPQCLLLDATGVFPLFSGEQPLTDLILRELAERRLSVRVAIADTIGSAWAAARFLTNAGPAIIPAGQPDAILALPVKALRHSPPLIEKHHKLGLKTIQQVQRLDRSALKARFGSDILLRMQQLTGECRELITPCRPAPLWEVRRDLESGTSDFQVAEQLCLAVLQDLIRMLQTRHLGASELCCRLLTEDRGHHEFSLRLREATADVRHLGELLRLKLEQVTLGSALVGIHLKAEASAPLKWHELQLFAEESRQQARQLTVLLDRLSNRLGPEAVVHALPRPDPIPERALEFVPVSQTPPASMAAAGQPLLPLDRPLCLLPEPEPIQVLAIVPEGPPSVLFWEGSRKVIAKCFGPERIESGWWRGASIRRDYYRVETQEGQQFWLFRRIFDQTWFLHGKAF